MNIVIYSFKFEDKNNTSNDTSVNTYTDQYNTTTDNSTNYTSQSTSDNTGQTGSEPELPKVSNFIFDLRSINDTAPSELTGLDMELITYFLHNNDMMDYIGHIIKLLDTVIQNFRSGDMIIGFGCASGRRKSIFTSEYVARYMNKTLQAMHCRDYTLVIKHMSTSDWINKYDDKEKIKQRKIYPV